MLYTFSYTVVLSAVHTLSTFMLAMASEVGYIYIHIVNRSLSYLSLLSLLYSTKKEAAHSPPKPFGLGREGQKDLIKLLEIQ